MLPPNLNQKQYIEFPSFATGGMATTLTGAKSEYNSAQFAYQKRFRTGLSTMANYTFSKCRSQSRQRLVNTIGGYQSLWLLGPDWSLCAADATHLFNVSAGFDLPFGQGRAILGNATGVLNQVVSGWRLNVIGNYSSGQPFTIGCTIATTTGHGCNALLTGEPLYPKNRNSDQWLNPAAFMNPPVATAVGQTDLSPLGGSPTQVRGPDFRKVDLSIFKMFNFSGSRRVEFRAEIFNVTNTPNFGIPGVLGRRVAATVGRAQFQQPGGVRSDHVPTARRKRFAAVPVRAEVLRLIGGPRAGRHARAERASCRPPRTSHETHRCSGPSARLR